ncbi:MAG: PDZ domain-containing protein [Planctomycetaceae bacterium]|jgi:carboxyl-terminal processing protease|nr:PDZ domain-containing protein [Planctomycetaceae bacterium]
MPTTHIYLILAAFAAYFLCAGTSMHDRILLYTLHRIERGSIYEPAEQSLFEGAMTGLLASAGDAYSMYIPPDDAGDYEDELNNRYGGIGINFFTGGSPKNPVVAYPVMGSPAADAGIQSGDTILEINGTSTDNKSFADISGLITSAADQPVGLTVLHFGEPESVKINVSAGIVQRDSVEGAYRDAGGHRVYRLETMPEIGYIRINSFAETTDSETVFALETILPDTADTAAVKALILDLRDNPGGFVHTAVAVARMFVEPTPQQNVIVTEKYRSGVKERLTLQAGEAFCRLPMSVIINGETASAAEILAAALQDYHRAKIVGSRSFGKGIVQQVVELPFDSGIVQFTAARYYRPSGQNIHRFPEAGDSDVWGVMPDAEVALSGDEVRSVMQWRDQCSNAVTKKRSEVLAEFRSRLKHSGTPPFYDPQLVKAVELLRQPND